MRTYEHYTQNLAVFKGFSYSSVLFYKVIPQEKNIVREF